MNPDDRAPRDPAEIPSHEVETVPGEDEQTGDDALPPEPTASEWWSWPPPPKMQIILIAIAFGLFNLILIGIWAAVMVYRFY